MNLVAIYLRTLLVLICKLKQFVIFFSPLVLKILYVTSLILYIYIYI